MNIVEFSLFGFTIAPSYYGLMYVLSFIYGIYFIKKLWKYSDSQRESLFFYIFLWVIVWWRLGYILFYNISHYISSPFDILRFWEWGMSFHWWVLWVVLATYIFAKRNDLHKWELWDNLAYIAPVGIFFGRIWNYINKELLGFPYSWPLAVQTSQGSFFPSPLVEALLEWVVIYGVLRYIFSRKRFHGQLLSVFLVLYALFRMLVEIFIRTPDVHIGYYFGFLTQWSLLSLPMLGIWIFLYYYLWKQNATK